jgi:hypothetical protein
VTFDARFMQCTGALRSPPGGLGVARLRESFGSLHRQSAKSVAAVSDA